MATITYIEVDTNQLDQDVDELEVNIHAVQKTLKKLQEEFEELNAMWTGDANLAFRKQIASDMTALEEIIEEVKKIHKCMKHASKEYVKCEGDVSDLVKKIAIY